MEGLVRTGKNQFLATLLIICAIVIGFDAIASTRISLPWTASTQDELTVMLAHFVFLSILTSFTFELILGFAGNRITEVVCKILRNSETSDQLTSQETSLEGILQEERVLHSEILRKPAFVRFYSVARYLSQERFKDFPELSPMRDLDSARLFALYGVAFLFLSAMGGMNLAVLHVSNNGTTSVLAGTVFSTTVATLLLVNARIRYVEGRSNTIISLREKIEEARKRQSEIKEKEKARNDGAERLEKAESELAAIRRDEFAKKLETIYDDLTSLEPSRRNVALAQLESSYSQHIMDLELPGPSLTTFLRLAHLVNNLIEQNMDAEAARLLSINEYVLRSLTSESSFYQLEDAITPAVAGILEKSPTNWSSFAAAARVARNLRSARIVEIIFSRLLKAGTAEIDEVAQRLDIERLLGTTLLAQLNKDKILETLKTEQSFARIGGLPSAARAIVDGLNYPERSKQEWPRALQNKIAPKG